MYIFETKYYYFLKLRQCERSIQVAHLLSCLDGPLDQPLNDWIHVDEVETLDLMRLYAVRALHSRQDGHDFFDKSAILNFAIK
jgi:hypothetical protein